jgi:hypothetical protein
MSRSHVALVRVLLVALMIAGTSAILSGKKQPPPPPPPPAKIATPPITNEYVHKEFGDDCSVLPGAPQFVGDLDDDGIDDVLIPARCTNPMADQTEFAFRVVDPYNSFLGFGNVKVTSTFVTDQPDRKGVCLLVVHGVGPEAWRSNKPKAKFILINLPFKTLAVKHLALRKRTVLGIYMEEQGEGEQTSSVVFWDGRKYRYQIIGADFE